jgi:phage major head subunit gpT-like protein
MATATDMRTAQIEAKALFLRGLQSVSNPLYQRLCTLGTMSTKTMETPIAGMIGPLREWTGPRQVENLQEDAYSITAKKYEKTVGVPREAFEDNTHGTYVAQLETFGQQVGAWPDQQVAKKLELGETDKCFDGTAFFNATHPVEHGNAAAGTFSNLTGSGQPPWYLFDLSKGVKPLLWMLRTAPEFVQKWNPDDDNVFFQDNYLSGVRARGVADYGFPQFAHKCKGVLDASTYETAVEAMMTLTNGAGENLGVYPTLLVVPTVLKGDAERLFEKQFGTGGESNTYWKNIQWTTWQRLKNVA